MTAVHEQTATFTIALTEEERAHLLSWLEERLKSTLVEEHRTDALTYKQYLVHEEALLESLIGRLRR
jgi:hypothetical protein